MEDEKSLVHDGTECSSRLHSEINQNETGFFSRLSRSDSLKLKSNNMFYMYIFKKFWTGSMVDYLHLCKFLF